MHREELVLKPSTALTIGMVLTVAIPTASLLAWVDSTYQRKETSKVVFENINKSLTEIKADLRELRQR